MVAEQEAFNFLVLFLDFTDGTVTVLSTAVTHGRFKYLDYNMEVKTASIASETSRHLKKSEARIKKLILKDQQFKPRSRREPDDVISSARLPGTSHSTLE